MDRASLGMVVLVAVSACGRVEQERFEPMAMGGTSAGGTSAGGASAGGASGAGSSSEPAGSGGLMQLPSALADCQRYCETLAYRLPQALCEDWHRPEWGRAQFCDVWTMPQASCADYCSDVYEAVTPECAAVLGPAIRCVAPTYSSASLPVVGTCWMAECRPQLFTMTSACYGLRERLAAARATWQASGVVDYQLTYGRDSDPAVQVTVRAGREPVVSPANAFAWTVPKLFDAVERALHEPEIMPSVSYDANLGYVVALSIEVSCGQPNSRITGVEVAPLR